MTEFLTYLSAGALSVVGMISFVAMLNMFTLAPKGRRKAIHDGSSMRDVLAGEVHASFNVDSSDFYKNGMSVIKDKKTGEISIKPMGTFSHNGILSLLFK